MDWPRARTYLILGFFALNLFLGFRVWQEHHAGGDPLDTPRWDPAFQELLGELESVGVSLTVELPWERPVLPVLEMEPARVEDCMFMAFFEPREGTVLEGPAGRLIRLPPLGVEFIPRSESGGGVMPSENQAILMAEDFFADLGGLPDNVELEGVRKGPGDTVTVLFRRIEQGIPVYPARLVVETGPGGVRRVENLLGGPASNSQPPMRVLEVEIALRLLVEELHARDERDPRALIRSELVYWGEPWDGAWKAVPAYRLELSDGVVMFVNALSGILEAYLEPDSS